MIYNNENLEGVSFFFLLLLILILSKDSLIFLKNVFI